MNRKKLLKKIRELDDEFLAGRIENAVKALQGIKKSALDAGYFDIHIELDAKWDSPYTPFIMGWRFETDAEVEKRMERVKIEKLVMQKEDAIQNIKAEIGRLKGE